jgi:outer membrane lipoprotein SlyB
LQLKRFPHLRGAVAQVRWCHIHPTIKGINVKQAFNLSSLRKSVAVAVVGIAALSGSVGAQAAQHHAPRCDSCGTVVSSHTYEQKAEHGSGAGAVTGALVGGFLGNRVGSGNGRKLATVAGAVGGGYAGNEIERGARSRTLTEVKVRMDNGAVRRFTEEGRRQHYQGEHVRVQHGVLVRR